MWIHTWSHIVVRYRHVEIPGFPPQPVFCAMSGKLTGCMAMVPSHIFARTRIASAQYRGMDSLAVGTYMTTCVESMTTPAPRLLTAVLLQHSHRLAPNTKVPVARPSGSGRRQQHPTRNHRGNARPRPWQGRGRTWDVCQRRPRHKTGSCTIWKRNGESIKLDYDCAWTAYRILMTRSALSRLPQIWPFFAP